MRGLQINRNEFFRMFTTQLCGSLDIKKALHQCALFLESISFPFDGIVLDTISDEPYTLQRIAGIKKGGELRGAGLISKVAPETWAFQQKHLKSNKILLMDAPENRRYAESLQSYTYGVLENSDMSMPVVFEGEPLGFLVFRAIGRNKYTKEHIALLNTVKEPVALAVANAIRFERERRHLSNGFNVELLFNRLKALKKIKTNAELAKKLGGQASNIANWKLRNTVPYDKIIHYCQFEQIPLDFIFMKDPFILNKRNESGYYAAVLEDNPKALLSPAEVENALKLPQGSLDAYIATCVKNTEIIPPADFVSEDDLNEFQRTVYKKQAGAGIVSSEHAIIPICDGTISHKGTISLSQEHGLFFRKKWIDKQGLSKKTFAYKMQGDSMSPTLLNGDVILIDPSQKSYAKSGGLYAVQIDDTLTVRRLMAAEKGNVLMICDNTIYPTEKTDRIRVIGKIVWYGRDM